MANVIGVRTINGYLKAEKFCDEWAGDCEAHVVVLEDFDADGWFIVCDVTTAEYILTDDERDVEKVYESNRTPEHMEAM